MVMIVRYMDRPAPFSLDPAIALLGNEKEGMALDFLTMRGYIRDRGTPANFFLGNLNELLEYQAPSIKFVMDSAGLLAPGTTLRCDHLADGTPLGVLSEESRTNVVLFNRDLGQTVWVAENVIVARDQTGIDGAAGSASSVRALVDGGTVLQHITLARSARFQTAWLKRLTGSGAVEMTMDGETWLPVSLTSDWTRVSISPQTIENPSVGFRLATGGDRIAVDFVQNEEGAFATSPIVTEDRPTVRTGDFFALATNRFPFNPDEGTFIVNYRPGPQGGVGRQYMVAEIADPSDRQAGLLASAVRGSLAIECRSAGFAAEAVFTAPFADHVFVNSGIAYRHNDSAGCFNGQTVQTDASSLITLSRVTVLGVGAQSDGSGQTNGHIRSLVYIPRRISAAELRARTASA